MTQPRRSPASSAKRPGVEVIPPPNPSPTAMVQSRVNQFFSAAPTDTTAAPPASSSSSRTTVASTSASSTQPTPTPPPAQRKRPTEESNPSTMTTAVADPPLLRENSQDPIVDSSPHRSAFATSSAASTSAPTGPSSPAPSSPPKKKKKSRKRSAKSQSPKTKAIDAGSSPPRASSETRQSSRRASSRLAAAYSPDRGGRGPMSAYRSSPGRGNGSNCRNQLAQLRADFAEPTDGDSEDDDLVRRAAQEIEARISADRRRAPSVGDHSCPPPPSSSAPLRVVPPSLSREPVSQSAGSGASTALVPAASVPTGSGPTAARPSASSLAPTTPASLVPVRPSRSTPPVAPAAPAAPDSDSETVVADNSEGNLVHRFVHQPTSTTTTAAAASTRTSAPPMAASRTTQQTNPYYAPLLLPRRPLEYRYEFRVLVPPSTQADVEMRSVFIQFFAKLKEADPTLVIHPWEDRENTTRQSGAHLWKSIATPSQIPTTIAGIKKYFPRAIPRASGGHVYLSCHLGHSKPLSEIKEEISWWFQQEQHGLWARQLQCESTYVVGWALYSTQSMSIAELRRVLGEALSFEIGIRWRTIQVEKSGPIPADQLAKALHFEVARSNRRQAKQRLSAIYARDATSFPLGIKLRLVWPLSDLMNFNTRAKVSALRLRQLQFVNHMKGMRTWELTSIDQPDERTGFTLRQRLTAIKSQKDGFQLFHSVDPSHIGDTVQFTFHPNREEEARAMVIALIPYLRWKMADEQPELSPVERKRFFSRALYRHFNRDALDRAVDAVWNPTTMSVDSPGDDYNGWINDVIDDELDCSLVATDATPASTIPTAPQGPVVRPHDAAGDQDSVSTLPQGHSVSSWTSSQSVRSPAPPPSVQPSPPSTSAAPSHGTPSRSATTPSSLTSDHPPEQLVSSLTSMIESFRSILDLLPPNNPATLAVRQQLESLPPGVLPNSASSPSTDPSPSSPGPAATGTDH